MSEPEAFRLFIERIRLVAEAASADLVWPYGPVDRRAARFRISDLSFRRVFDPEALRKKLAHGDRCVAYEIGPGGTEDG